MIHTANRFPEVEEAGDLPVADDHEHLTGDTAADNTLRAMWAAEAVAAFAERTGISDETPELALSDLMGNVRHLCDALGLDFDDVDSRGQMHYTAELAGD